MIGRRTFYLHLDPGLKLFHSERSCPDARVAAKYGDLESVAVREGDAEALAGLRLCGSPCPRCNKREAQRPASHIRPPGFRGVLS